MNNKQTNQTMENTAVVAQISGASGYFEFCFATESDYKRFLQDQIEIAKNDANYERHYTYRNRKVIAWKDGGFTRYTLIK